ncbi:restriction endonuclease subunit S [Serratia sp. OPWLW2]|uniref:restriction endonuclease subunit S n=1 Tax=Serratia sp. OPWLW2 TaxID=1928658 RepID=UPI000C1811AD|nr:restriction endonuclease subunit S [Serratia sp. OPWLW2]PIJ43715.1 restriction endonuclease subunit S [Serratia sp. OPWLW2]
MSVDNKVPEIRFKGFSEKWQEREFSNIATRVSTHHQSTCLPCVEYEDIVAGKGRLNKDIHQKKSFKTGLKFEADDVLFGKLRPYLKNWFLADFEGLAVGDFWVLRADNVASTFLFSLIQTNEFELISNLSAGSKMPRSDWGLVSSSCFFVPKNIYESNEIGNYFQKLDTLINQHQQKHDKLSSIKKSMLEKMFPKQGETIPEIRFKGFSGEWEEKMLGTDIAEIIGGGTPSTSISEFWDGDIDWYSPTEIGENVYAEGSQKKITPLGLKSCSAKILPAGNTVLFTSRAGIGDMAILTKPGSTNQGFQSLIVKEGYSPYFIFSAGKQIKDFALKHASGSTFLEISGKQLGRMKILMPSLEEQTAIGNYFEKLDSLINQYQQQITKLNNIKQACLSKMFV